MARSAEEAGKGAGAETIADDLGNILPVALRALNALVAATAKHQHGHDDHQNREQKEQLVPIDALAERRAAERTDDAGSSIDPPASPVHGAGMGMVPEASKRIGRDGQCTGADRLMRIADAYEI